MALARYVWKHITVPFLSTDWVNNSITIIPSGTPLLGQIGPHRLSPMAKVSSRVYQNIDSDRTKEVGLTIIHDKSNNTIKLFKASKIQTFSGLVFLELSR